MPEDEKKFYSHDEVSKALDEQFKQAQIEKEYGVEVVPELKVGGGFKDEYLKLVELLLRRGKKWPTDFRQISSLDFQGDPFSDIKISGSVAVRGKEEKPSRLEVWNGPALSCLHKGQFAEAPAVLRLTPDGVSLLFPRANLRLLDRDPLRPENWTEQSR